MILLSAYNDICLPYNWGVGEPLYLRFLTRNVLSIYAVSFYFMIVIKQIPLTMGF